MGQTRQGWMKELDVGRSPSEISRGGLASSRDPARVLAARSLTGITRDEAASSAVGVSQAGRADGSATLAGCPLRPGPLSGRYLSFTEREEIALLEPRVRRS